MILRLVAILGLFATLPITLIGGVAPAGATPKPTNALSALAATPRVVTRTITFDTTLLCNAPEFFVGQTSLGLSVGAAQLANTTTVDLDAVAAVDLAFSAQLR